MKGAAAIAAAAKVKDDPKGKAPQPTVAAAAKSTATSSKATPKDKAKAKSDGKTKLTRKQIIAKNRAEEALTRVGEEQWAKDNHGPVAVSEKRSG